MKIPLADGEKELIETAAQAERAKPVTWAVTRFCERLSAE